MNAIALPISCIAVDFGGTLAGRHIADVDGAAITTALAQCAQWKAPREFADSLDRAMAEARSHDRVTLLQTPFAEILHDAAERIGCAPPAEGNWAERVFDLLPDARIDAAAAKAVLVLADRGLRLVLASNTRWPFSARRKTLYTAGIADVFHALVLSTGIGVRKPHPDFYRAVLENAGCPASEVLFVGDTVDKDVDPPRRLGMQSLLVAPVWEPRVQPGRSGAPHFADLPAILEAASR